MKLSFIKSILCALALLWAMGSAQAAEIVPGKQYRGPVTLESAQAGLSFRLPAGWIGAQPQGSEFFVMKSSRTGALVLAGGSEMTVRDAKQQMSNAIPLDRGVTLQPKGRPQVRGKRIRASYTVPGQAGYVGFIETVVGSHGAGVYFVGLGRAEHHVDRTVTSIANSVRLSKPKVASANTPADKKWVSALAGRKLTRFYTTSGYTEEQRMWLYKNGRFSRRFNSGGSTPGMASGATQSGSQGTWTVSKNTLILRYDNGSTATYSLRYGKGLELDGKRWFREPL